MADSTSAGVEIITDALRDYGQKIQSGGQTAIRLSTAVKSLADAFQATNSALLNSEQSFTKYQQSVKESQKFLNAAGVYFFRGSGARLTILGLASVAQKVVNAVLESNDVQLAAFDRLSKLGVNLGTTAEGLTEITNNTGLWSKRNEGLMKSTEKLGTGLTNLGENTNKGVRQLSKILNVTDGVTEEFMRLGLSVEELMTLQTDYVSIQTMLGPTIEKDAAKEQKASRDYVTTLMALSALTGNNVTSLSAQMAEAKRDNQFRTRLTLLRQTTEGRVVADRYELAETIAQSFFGDETAKGVRDFLATGTATTKEGEALLLKTRGQISGWVQDLKAGRITADEFNNKIAKASLDFEKDNREALMLSEDFQRKSGSSAKVLEGARKKLEGQSLEDAKAEVEKQKLKKQMLKDGEEGLKEQDIIMFKLSQKVGITNDKLATFIQEPINGVLRKMADYAQTIAVGTIRLAAWMLGKEAKIDEALAQLGTTEDANNYLKNLDKAIKDVDKQINDQKQIINKQKQLEEETTKNKEKKQVLQQKITETADPTQKKKYQDDLKVLEQQIQQGESATTPEAKKAEQDKLTKLENERKELEQKKKKTEQRKEEKQKEEKRTETNRTSYLSYLRGPGVNAEDWSNVTSDFKDKVIGMAKKYYMATGQKLYITDSYRSKEKQLDMYNEWRKAGGQYPKEGPNHTVYTPKYGNLSIPSQEPGQHGAGIAVDIDRKQLDFLDERGLLDEFGLKRHRPVEQDPVHVSPKFKFGGIFDPSQGDTATLHGLEAKLPLVENTIPIELKKPDDLLDIGEITKDFLKPTTSIPPSKVKRANSKDLADLLLNKIDQMNNKIMQSNSIYSDIKLYVSN